MNIGILTFHNIPNIGALLQALALCLTIKKSGHECEIIDYRCENLVKRELTYHARKGKLKDLIYRINWKKTEKKIRECTAYMTTKNLFSKCSYDRSTIAASNLIYDMFVSGSDMIWNLKVTNYDYTYMLDFTDDSKTRISYGSSIGATWEEKDLGIVRGLLSRYKALSVREADTCDTIKNLGLNCQHVCDPTMLLTSEEWSNMAENVKEHDYVIVYFPTDELIASAKFYAKKHNLKVLVLNWGLPSMHYKSIMPNTPPSWVGYFKNANAVFTNSYHGLLFALYFSKPVWTANYGNRVMSLVESLGIPECLLNRNRELNPIIDFSKVHSIMDSIRKESIEYLNNMLK